MSELRIACYAATVIGTHTEEKFQSLEAKKSVYLCFTKLIP
jgi:hypothetical protein